MAIGTLAAPGEGHVGLEEWLNLEAIKLFTHHTSAIVAAVVLFWLVGWLVRKLVHDGVFKRVVLLLDELVLVCIFAYFAYELLFLLFIRVIQAHAKWPS
jgi:heme A synthase